ncbi:MAG: signal peptidase II [Candidatus Coatesbacteria bacterium]
MAWRLTPVAAWALAVVVIDLLTKRLIEQSFRLGECTTIVDWAVSFKICYIRNPGVAFGLLADLAWRWRLPFFLATAAAAGWILWEVFKEAGHLVLGRLSLGLIVGGAVGNFVDRVRYGEVVDFLDFWFGRWHFPTFNVADSGITVGTGLLLIALWKVKAL